MKKLILTLLFFMFTGMSAIAASPVYVASSKQPVDKVYKSVYASLEKNGFFVVFEPDIGANISGMAKRWGEDYNRNKLSTIRSMVFCNGWYANQVSNTDPEMLALCPLSLTVTEKAGVVKVLFVRPDEVAKDSPAAKVTAELTKDVIKAIDEGIKAAEK